ncbi:MAG: SpoIVB peptidase [Clostridiales bacterium]|nr:SpoIVB peptidase [Clostridiales bacterium]
MMNVRKRYRRFVCVLLLSSVFALILCGLAVFHNMELQKSQIESSAPVAERKKVYLGGTPIGIYLETDGVFVVDTGTVTAEDGTNCCPAENIVCSGDYIQAVNGEQVHTKEELVACIAKYGSDELILDVDRQGEQIRLRVTPVMDEEGAYKAGIWVRNDTQGIGTLTWVDEEGYFGALGHGISDVDTAELLNIQNGTLYSAEVVSVIKGSAGEPGELSGIIHYSDSYKIGTIEENNENGIYGRITGFSLAVQNRTLYETAFKQEVETGPATIMCTVDGTCREYEIRIREVRENGSDVNKRMVIEVTDPELLELTGGIVQGMSGSPILQNGRLIGAVTHVFVADSTKGYGIFIENML